jgi:flagellar biogenesis protein FliO
METLRQAGSVLMVFALLGAVLWVLRRKGTAVFATTLGNWRRAPSRERSLASLERLALTPSHSLHLVRIGGREVVVATYPSGCSLLGESKKEVDS